METKDIKRGPGRPRIEGRVRLVVRVPSAIRDDVLRVIRQMRKEYDGTRK